MEHAKVRSLSVPTPYKRKYCVLFSSFYDPIKIDVQMFVILSGVAVKKRTGMVQGGGMSLSLVQRGRWWVCRPLPSLSTCI